MGAHFKTSAYRTGSCGSSEVNWAKMEPGGLGQLFRLLLGPRRGPEGGQDGPHQQPNRDHDQWPPNERPVRDEAELYKVFTNPLEMNRFFEEQMDEMLRNFGQGFFGGDLRTGPPGPWGGHLQPALPQPHEENGSKRDLMLRDPHSHVVPDTPAKAKQLEDEDLSDNWQSLLGEKRMPGKQGQLFGSEEESRSGCSPSERGLPRGWFGNRGFGGGAFDFGNQGSSGLEQSPGGGGGGVKFFSSSVSESTVRGPDGGLETTRIVRNSDGREEVTVTKRLADGSSTTETRVTGGGKLAGEGTGTALDDGSWTVVPRGGMSVPGPRDEMLGQNPESVLGDLWQTFFGK